MDRDDHCVYAWFVTIRAARECLLPMTDGKGLAVTSWLSLTCCQHTLALILLLNATCKASFSQSSYQGGICDGITCW